MTIRPQRNAIEGILPPAGNSRDLFLKPGQSFTLGESPLHFIDISGPTYLMGSNGSSVALFSTEPPAKAPPKAKMREITRCSFAVLATVKSKGCTFQGEVELLRLRNNQQESDIVRFKRTKVKERYPLFSR